MSGQTLQNPRTASLPRSVWRYLSEDVFRAHVIELERATSGVPTEPQVFSFTGFTQAGSLEHEDRRVLPIAVECRLADDLAYIAAAEEGVKSVTAVCLEEHEQGNGLVWRLAANEGISEIVQASFRDIADALMECAAGQSKRSSFRKVLKIVLNLHRPRILGRLRSTKWVRPPHLRVSNKASFSEYLRNLLEMLNMRLSTKNSKLFSLNLQELLSDVENLETLPAGSDAEIDRLEQICQKAFVACTSDGTCTLLETLNSAGMDSGKLAQDKTIREVEKLGAYWRIPDTLIKAAKKFRALFSHIQLHFHSPYSSVQSPIFWEKSKESSKSCHVHAEIQLLFHYGLYSNGNTLQPRSIGTSKDTCFLCCKFIRRHGQFFISKTHGRCFDQWTIPDLAEFSSSKVELYRRVVADMNRDFVKLAKSRAPWRPHPMTSRQNISRILLFSVENSSAGTVRPTTRIGGLSSPLGATQEHLDTGLGVPSTVHDTVVSAVLSKQLEPLCVDRSAGLENSLVVEKDDQVSPINIGRCVTLQECAGMKVYTEFEALATGTILFKEVDVSETVGTDPIVIVHDLKIGEDITLENKEIGNEMRITFETHPERFAQLCVCWD